ncbi:10331_t:CDS:2 [Acaulospora colombiana]|uniref:10331_t:CDS:1 n=1 Tax=Acaulospora colombiana TaxID=27376 RepID=A0ACA9K0J5_9GLOM|nr:10331_t:CDS:2 [Acaulospora colombiana]
MNTHSETGHQETSSGGKNPWTDDINAWEPERYEVENVLSRRWEDGQELFLVQWKGYSKDTWEPRENLDNCPELLERFFQMAQETELITQMNVNVYKNYENIWCIGPEERKIFYESYEMGQMFNEDMYDKLILKSIATGKGG